MKALFGSSLQGGEFVSNAIVPLTQASWFPTLATVLTRMHLRDEVVDVLAFLFVFFQVDSYQPQTLRSSEESRNVTIGSSLYDWTISQLKHQGYLV